jgi:hypothetical protein
VVTPTGGGGGGAVTELDGDEEGGDVGGGNEGAGDVGGGDEGAGDERTGDERAGNVGAGEAEPVLTAVTPTSRARAWQPQPGPRLPARLLPHVVRWGRP